MRMTPASSRVSFLEKSDRPALASRGPIMFLVPAACFVGEALQQGKASIFMVYDEFCIF